MNLFNRKYLPYWDDAVMRSADEMSLDAQCILALIMGAIRVDRFCEGALLSFFEAVT